jgi:hypothetical protein
MAMYNGFRPPHRPKDINSNAIVRGGRTKCRESNLFREAADTKIAMINIQQTQKQKKLKSKMLFRYMRTVIPLGRMGRILTIT